MLDTHFHLDFIADPSERAKFIAELDAQGVGVVAQTLTPAAFQSQTAPLLALGYHPWNAGEDQLDLFRELASDAQFIGEVGLDFSPQRVANVSAERQIEVFDTVLKCASGQPMSIHAVQAAGVAVEMLAGVDAIPIFHWFSGTSDELTSLIRRGGYISVNPRMLASKRGRAYVRQVPANRLLLETDMPQTVVDRVSAAAHIATLHQLVASLSELRGEDMAPILAATEARVFGV